MYTEYKAEVPENLSSFEYNPSIDSDTAGIEDNIEEVKKEPDHSVFTLNLEQVFAYDMLGVKPVMMAIFSPVFFYLATRGCKTMEETPHVPQPM